MLRFFFTPPAKAFCSARQRTRAIAAHQTPFPSLPSSHHTINCAPTPVRVPPCHPRGLPPAHPHLARGSMAKDAVPPRLPSSETPDSSSSAVAALAVAVVVAVNSSRERTSPTQNEPHRPSATRPKEPNNPVPIVSRTHAHTPCESRSFVPQFETSEVAGRAEQGRARSGF